MTLIWMAVAAVAAVVAWDYHSLNITYRWGTLGAYAEWGVRSPRGKSWSLRLGPVEVWRV